MPREHARISYKMWRDKEFRALPRDAQTMYMQLLSQKEINNAGILPLLESNWARGCDDLTVDDVRRDLDRLQAERFVFFDEETNEVFIRSFIRNDGIVKQPNLLKNAYRCAEQVESHTLRVELAAELRRIGRRDADAVAEQLDPSGNGPEGDRKGSETLSEPLNPSGTLSKPCGVGVGEGVGEPTADGYGGEEPRPPKGNLDPNNPRCSDHATIPATDRGPNCRACGHVRQWVESEPDRRREQIREGARRTKALIADCSDCDEAGWVKDLEPVVRCKHERRESA